MGELLCKIMDSWIPVYVEGNLDKDTERIVKKHIAECKTCKAKLNKEKQA